MHGGATLHARVATVGDGACEVTVTALGLKTDAPAFLHW